MVPGRHSVQVADDIGTAAHFFQCTFIVSSSTVRNHKYGYPKTSNPTQEVVDINISILF